MRPTRPRYETSMYGMNLNIERKLVATDQGYRLSSEGKSFAATLSEVADFSVTDGPDWRATLCLSVKEPGEAPPRGALLTRRGTHQKP